MALAGTAEGSRADRAEGHPGLGDGLPSADRADAIVLGLGLARRPLTASAGPRRAIDPLRGL
ncbi:hypothetical protein ACFV9D_34645 [Streptomyces sp. NPDC059875]|uniref:hypothetical protein n=1 Tax=unclassified Streptomyces TaxID=2593676 RepID=UPI00365082E6